MLRLLRSTSSSVGDILKKEKEIPAGLAVAPQTVKMMAAVHDKCLGKLGKTLNLQMGGVHRKQQNVLTAEC